MKHILNIVFFSSVLFLASCIKQDSKEFSGQSLVEFDAAVMNAPATGKDFPLVTRKPQGGLPVRASAPTGVTVCPPYNSCVDTVISRANATVFPGGVVMFRVNLVGPQSGTAQTIPYTVVAGETTAVAGTHYTTSGNVVIPANSSFGWLAVTILQPAASATPVDLVLELQGAGNIKPSQNYKRLGIRIAQN